MLAFWYAAKSLSGNEKMIIENGGGGLVSYC